MEAKELMVGDWVLYNPNVFIEDEYEPPKVCYPKKINSGEDLDLAIEGCYAPIPLTPEILERIGFTVEEDPIYEECYVDVDAIEQTYTAKMKCGDVKNRYAEIRYETDEKNIDVLVGKPWQRVQMKIEYVHELQHIMRLLGIGKEIIL